MFCFRDLNNNTFLEKNKDISHVIRPFVSPLRGWLPSGFQRDDR